MATALVARSTELFGSAANLSDAANALVDDSFFRCFTSAPPDPWNWNLYLLCVPPLPHCIVSGSPHTPLDLPHCSL